MGSPTLDPASLDRAAYGQAGRAGSITPRKFSIRTGQPDNPDDEETTDDESQQAMASSRTGFAPSNSGAVSALPREYRGDPQSLDRPAYDQSGAAQMAQSAESAMRMRTEAAKPQIQSQANLQNAQADQIRQQTTALHRGIEHGVTKSKADQEPSAFDGGFFHHDNPGEGNAPLSSVPSLADRAAAVKAAVSGVQQRQTAQAGQDRVNNIASTEAKYGDGTAGTVSDGTTPRADGPVITDETGVRATSTGGALAMLPRPHVTDPALASSALGGNPLMPPVQAYAIQAAQKAMAGGVTPATSATAFTGNPGPAIGTTQPPAPAAPAQPPQAPQPYDANTAPRPEPAPGTASPNPTPGLLPSGRPMGSPIMSMPRTPPSAAPAPAPAKTPAEMADDELKRRAGALDIDAAASRAVSGAAATAGHMARKVGRALNPMIPKRGSLIGGSGGRAQDRGPGFVAAPPYFQPPAHLAALPRMASSPAIDGL